MTRLRLRRVVRESVDPSTHLPSITVWRRTESDAQALIGVKLVCTDPVLDVYRTYRVTAVKPGVAECEWSLELEPAAS